MTVSKCSEFTTVSFSVSQAEQENFEEEGSSLLRSRFYENKYPEPEEVVMVNVTEIGEMGAYVQLLEYDNIPVSVRVHDANYCCCGRDYMWLCVSQFSPCSPTHHNT